MGVVQAVAVVLFMVLIFLGSELNGEANWTEEEEEEEEELPEDREDDPDE